MENRSIEHSQNVLVRSLETLSVLAREISPETGWAPGCPAPTTSVLLA
jgi:hypothetical protein